MPESQVSPSAVPVALLHEAGDRGRAFGVRREPGCLGGRHQTGLEHARHPFPVPRIRADLGLPRWSVVVDRSSPEPARAP